MIHKIIHADFFAAGALPVGVAMLLAPLLAASPPPPLLLPLPLTLFVWLPSMNTLNIRLFATPRSPHIDQASSPFTVAVARSHAAAIGSRFFAAGSIVLELRMCVCVRACVCVCVCVCPRARACSCVRTCRDAEQVHRECLGGLQLC